MGIQCAVRVRLCLLLADLLHVEAQDLFLPVVTRKEPIIKTTTGSLRGRHLNSGVVAYLGVPFAEAPVGRLRFRPSQAPTPWLGVRDATKFGPACLQTAATGAYQNISEDCLYLNIWAPREEITCTSPLMGTPCGEGSAAKLPVFFWIHGGAFISGSGQDYNGTRLAQQGLIVVTTNYRLAGLGFYASPALAKEDLSYPSNGGMNGIGDQLLALSWVRHNIASFGGDPEQLTIAGESSGGISVSYLLHTPLAQGKFRRAIAESGSFIVIANESGLPKPASEAVAASTVWESSLECLPSLDGLACMRQLHADELLKNGAWYGIRPSIDGVIFTEDPVHLPSILQNQQVDVILGSTSLDTVCAPPFDKSGSGTVSTKPVPTNCATFSGNLSVVFGASSGEVAPQYVCHERASAHEVALLWLRLSRDVSICCPMQWLAEKLLATGPHASVWMYEFAFNAAVNWTALAGHGAELGYVFDDPSVGYFENKHWDPQLAKTMSHLWSRFAEMGDPTSQKTWPRYDPITDRYLHFDVDVRIGDGYAKHCNCDFWKSFLKATTQARDHVKKYRAMVNMCFQ